MKLKEFGFENFRGVWCRRRNGSSELEYLYIPYCAKRLRGDQIRRHDDIRPFESVLPIARTFPYFARRDVYRDDSASHSITCCQSQYAEIGFCFGTRLEKKGLLSHEVVVVGILLEYSDV